MKIHPEVTIIDEDGIIEQMKKVRIAENKLYSELIKLQLMLIDTDGTAVRAVEMEE